MRNKVLGKLETKFRRCCKLLQQITKTWRWEMASPLCVLPNKIAKLKWRHWVVGTPFDFILWLMCGAHNGYAFYMLVIAWVCNSSNSKCIGDFLLSDQTKLWECVCLLNKFGSLIFGDKWYFTSHCEVCFFPLLFWNAVWTKICFPFWATFHVENSMR